MEKLILIVTVSKAMKTVGGIFGMVRLISVIQELEKMNRVAGA